MGRPTSGGVSLMIHEIASCRGADIIWHRYSDVREARCAAPRSFFALCSVKVTTRSCDPGALIVRDARTTNCRRRTSFLVGFIPLETVFTNLRNQGNQVTFG